MTDTPKPLTADEIADLKAKAKAALPIAGLHPLVLRAKTIKFNDTANPETVQRLIATIEQQREQIEKLRKALQPFDSPTRIVSADDKEPRTVHIELFQAELIAARLVLAATDLKP